MSSRPTIPAVLVARQSEKLLSIYLTPVPMQRENDRQQRYGLRVLLREQILARPCRLRSTHLTELNTPYPVLDKRTHFQKVQTRLMARPRVHPASFDFPVWSSARKIAVPTPSGMVASMQTPIINRVDTIIGAMPPDLPESVGCSVRNVQFTCANPAVTTEYSSRQAAEQTTNAHNIKTATISNPTNPDRNKIER